MLLSISLAKPSTMTRDSDIAIIADDCFICIKTYTNWNYEIACTLEENLCKPMQFHATNTKAIFSKAVIPLFNGVANPCLRALLMLILGCDVYGQGMKGVGGKKLMNMIKQSEHKVSEDDFFVSLQDQFMAKNELMEEAVHTYIDAIVF
jgi:hypothetical protein